MEKRSTLSKPSRWLIDALGGSQSYTGKSVNPESALTFTAVYACVRILSETVASLPLPVYERLQPKGKRKAPNHYLYSVLHDKANEEMTAFTFRETMMNHLLLWGNAYAEIQYDGAGRVVGLWPLRPDKTFPERVNGKLVYKTILPNGEVVVLDSMRVLHIPGMGFDGLVGYNPIRLAREAIGLGLAAEEYGARFFANGAKPGGVLEHPGSLSETALNNLRQSWNEMHQGLDKQHRIAILEEGMQYKQIGIPPEEAQFLETRKFQVTEIARFFRVPPHMLADLERATFSNIEQQSIDFVTHSIRPWLVRWEQSLNAKPFGRDWGRRYFAEFKVDALLRGDIKSRYEAYAIARQNGWLSADDIRELENMNPLPDGQGEMYLVPLNMVPADSIGEIQSETNPKEETPNEDRTIEKRGIERRQLQSAETRTRISRSYKRIFEQTFQRIINREEADVMRQAKKMLGQRNLENFLFWLSDFYRQHEEYIEKQTTPILMSLAEAMKGEAAREVGGEEGMTKELEDFVYEYLALFSRRHIGNSINQLKRALEEAVEGNQIEALQETFNDWKENRVKSEAQEETFRASNAFTLASYIALGVRKTKWKADSNPCPFCRKLDGKVIDIHSSYIRKGESLEVEGHDPFIPDGNIKHGPLHRGCECTIVSSFV
jgi:HK97 family phage portal protein